MKIHEYQAKALLAQHGVAIPRGEVAFSGGEAFEIAQKLGGTVVVKAQIHAGGRGKAAASNLLKPPRKRRKLPGGCSARS